MEVNEIKELLSCYRPESVMDAGHERIQEALDAVRQNPKLAAWLEGEQAFDRAFAARIASAPVPGDLRDGILAKMREAGPDAGDNPGTQSAKAQANLIDGTASFADSSSTSRSRSKRSLMPVYGLLAAAAAVVVTLIVVFQAPRSDYTVADFRTEMAKRAATGDLGLQKVTTDIGEARDWLAAHNAPISAKVPGKIVEFSGMGCGVLDWGGNKISLVCFKRDLDTVHLFVMKKEALNDATSPAKPLDEVLVQHELQTGGWTDDQHVYLFVGGKAGVDISPLVKP